MVAVIGLGFVGLTTALCFAESGYPVYGVEAAPERLRTISQGHVPFEEPGLEAALKRRLGKTFFPTGDPALAVRNSEFLFYCVGTPCGEGGEADLRALTDALRQTLSHPDGRRRIVVVKSTVPPGTTRGRIRPVLEELGYELPGTIGLACNPEFLREGHCWEDAMHADRIVLGVNDPVTEQRLRDLYAPFNAPIEAVSQSTAEFIKYLSNCALASLISFSNEMSLAAEAFGDVQTAEAFRILHMDKRWQTGSIRNYCYPGIGYGGYCLPKDTKAFYAAAKARGAEAGILREVIRVNERMPVKTAERIMAAAGPDRSRCIGILGVSFNAGSDDVRGSVSAVVIRLLNEAGYRNLLVFDPLAMESFETLYHPDCRYAASLEDLLREAELAAILVRWPQFRDVRAKTEKPVLDCVYMTGGEE